MIGRRGPLARIESLLDAARQGRAGALVITGEAGIGKTALLDEIAANAHGFVLLRSRGIESEMALDHAGLLQLLGPLDAHLDGVPGPQRRALEAALGWGQVEPGDSQFWVAAGALALIAAAAEHSPILVMVDDLHWLDSASAAAVLFTARRLVHDAVAILLATRNGAPPGSALDGLDMLELPGLSLSEATELAPPGTAPEVIARLLEATRGNPLALIEIVRSLTPAQLRGAGMLPDPLPCAGRLEEVYEPTLASLPIPTRQAVLIAAASGEDAAEPLRAALRALDLDPDATLADAEVRGVLVQGPGVVRFRHPLLRSAAWASATASERRGAHAALGMTLPDTRRRERAWHRAEAATAPDATLAADLEDVAEEERKRSGHAAASVALERASRLSDAAGPAMDRLAGAVEDAALAGDIVRTRQLAGRVLTRNGDHPATGRALSALGTLEHYAGSVRRAAQLLDEAIEHSGEQLQVRALAERAMVCHRLGDYSRLAAIADRLAAVADCEDPHQQFMATLWSGVSAMVSGQHDLGRSALADAFGLYESEPSVRDDPRHLVLASLTVAWLGLDPGRAAFLEGRLAHARARGALMVLVPTLAMFAHGRAWLFGDHVTAYAEAGEAVELGSELGFVADLAPALELLAWQHAARGAHHEAEVELERSARLVEQAGTTAVAAHLALARAFCALCRGDFEEVVAVLEPRFDVDGGRGAMGEQLGIAPPLVEAYAALRRDEEAASLAGRFAGTPEPDAPTRALIARCAALTSREPTAAVDAFETAIRIHIDSHDAPFELARTELLLGSLLRRQGKRTAARPPLRSARGRFAAMDLTLWVERATTELAATGETVRPRGHPSSEPLTSQETRVAILVGQGLTNREVAAALFVSPRTVEYHLSNVYRKRGLRSRSELARAMADRPDTE